MKKEFELCDSDYTDAQILCLVKCWGTTARRFEPFIYSDLDDFLTEIEIELITS